jgi:hypothetical protein
MEDVLIGLVVIVAGALFSFAGYLALRFIIPFWGGISGFLLGAGAVASISDDGYLSTLLGWVVGFVVGILFGALAYLYYEVSVVVAMSAIGFTLGTGAMVALGLTWSWLIVVIGFTCGVLLAIAAIAADLPMMLLVILSALAGAVTIIGGLMLVFGAIGLGDLAASTTDRLHDSWGWYLAYVTLVVAGLVVQLRGLDRTHRSMADSWEASSGRRPASEAPIHA